MVITKRKPLGIKTYNIIRCFSALGNFFYYIQEE